MRLPSSGVGGSGSVLGRQPRTARIRTPSSDARYRAQQMRKALQNDLGEPVNDFEDPPAPRLPARDLMRAVLIQAVHDLCTSCVCRVDAKGRERICHRCTAWWWIHQPTITKRVSFAMVCDALDFNPQWMRKHLLAINAQPVGETTWHPSTKLGVAV